MLSILKDVHLRMDLKFQVRTVCSKTPLLIQFLCFILLLVCAV